MLGFRSLLELLTVFDGPSLATTVRVPPALFAEQDLFTELAMQLSFPPYFGNNWDALDECLADLAWLEPGSVAIVHADLPLSGDPRRRDTYLDVLLTAEEWWKQQPERELTVCFPPALERYVRERWGRPAAPNDSASGGGSPTRRRAAEIQSEIATVLMRQWDPIGVSDVPEAVDEYDRYVGGVFGILQRAPSIEGLVGHLRRIEVEQMGLSPGDPDRRRRVAMALLEVDISLPRP